MLFRTYSHRNAEVIFENDPKYQNHYLEVLTAIKSISDTSIINEFNKSPRKSIKSISEPINHLVKKKLVAVHWKAESPIFKDNDYTGDTWRLDFAKSEISIEVAFNHASVISWNLLKPVLASELNHVEKAIQTSAGIIICATEEMKKAGNFDSAVGTFEKYIQHLKPLYNQLTSPLLIIGIEAPKTFRINPKTKTVEKLQ